MKSQERDIPGYITVDEKCSPAFVRTPQLLKFHMQLNGSETSYQSIILDNIKMSASHWFPKTYTELKRFHESVNQLESLVIKFNDSLSLDLVGPDGEDLTIDIAVLGSLTSKLLLCLWYTRR